tara:strand:- start:1617 stop:2144 length:528 start_codon:yes stop_codon:yes gene_type:complete
MDSSKTIQLPSIAPKTEKIVKSTKKEKKERIIINKERWNFDESVYNPQQQYDVLCEKNDGQCYKKMIQQINRKINSYKQQDKTKNLFNDAKLININQVIELLLSCNFICYYCQKMVHVLYKNVREPLQWTLERLDNDYGHNHDNVVISCLECNLHRRTMYHERYVFTKQLVIKKI